MRHRNKERIALSIDAFTNMKSIFTKSNIKVYTKINTLKLAYIWSILLYGCECWTLTKDLERRLEAVEMWYIRRNNEKIMDCKDVKRRSDGNGWIQKIRTQNNQKKTTTIFWHINRADGFEKQIALKDLWYQKQRKTTHKTHRQSE